MTQPQGNSAKKLRVLIADDVHETRRSTRLMLSMIPGVEVVAIAANGTQLLQMTAEQRPDILVTDINMPELDGMTAASRVMHAFPGTGCIIMSTERQPETIEAAKKLGVMEYLIKPFTLDELADAVRSVADQLVLARRNIQRTQPVVPPDMNALYKKAAEFAAARRTDDEAVRVFEFLAANPQCDLRWLRTLAMMYVIRQEWGKLKTLAERLERTR